MVEKRRRCSRRIRCSRIFFILGGDNSVQMMYACIHPDTYTCILSFELEVVFRFSRIYGEREREREKEKEKEPPSRDIIYTIWCLR